MKVNVIKDKCIGCGNCVALTESQIFDFNEDGLAETIVEEINEDMMETVKDAITQCPTEAIVEVNE
jgi:ferredoxin